MNLPGLIVSLLVDSCFIPKNAPVEGSQLRPKSYLLRLKPLVFSIKFKPARMFSLALKTALASITLVERL